MYDYARVAHNIAIYVTSDILYITSSYLCYHLSSCREMVKNPFNDIIGDVLRASHNPFSQSNQLIQLNNRHLAPTCSWFTG